MGIPPIAAIDAEVGKKYNERYDNTEALMSAAETIFEEALRLKPVERAALIEELYHSFDPAGRGHVEALWAEEAEARIDAYDKGMIQADSAEAVFRRINTR